MPRIVVAEDEPKISALVRDYLTAAGFVVTVVADGESALREARNGPDLVVLDL